MARPRKKKLPAPPLCAHCDQPAHLVTGREIYPHRPDLYDKNLWKCTPCDAWVGCHRGGGGSKPLGRPANLALRTARGKLHTLRFDPLWKSALSSGVYSPEDQRAEIIIKTAARSRCYAYLAHKLAIDVKACHIGEFTLEQCRAAWSALFNITYPEIREWARAQKIAAVLAEHVPTANLQALKHAALEECGACRLEWPIDENGIHLDAGEACAALSVRRAIEWIEEHPEEAAARRAAVITPQETTTP